MDVWPVVDGLRRGQGAGELRECLMITSSRNTSKWIFPKGGWENDETLEQCAIRETLEVSSSTQRARTPTHVALPPNNTVECGGAPVSFLTVWT